VVSVIIASASYSDSLAPDGTLTIFPLHIAILKIKYAVVFVIPATLPTWF
jgi:hypothetical protein